MIKKSILFSFFTLYSVAVQSQILENETYSLKGGYELHKIAVGETIFWSIKKGDKITTISEEEYEEGALEKYYKGVRADFDDFLLMTTGGGNYIIYPYLFDKATGKDVFEGRNVLLCNYNEDANCFIYTEYNLYDDELQLFDLENRVVINFKYHKMIKDVQPSVVSHMFFEVVEADKKYITVKYDGEIVTIKKIKRPSKPSREIKAIIGKFCD